MQYYFLTIYTLAKKVLITCLTTWWILFSIIILLYLGIYLAVISIFFIAFGLKLADYTDVKGPYRGSQLQIKLQEDEIVSTILTCTEMLCMWGGAITLIRSIVEYF